MAGYQRFVAYVYEYRKGKKDSSSGYVRVEARDRRCLIEVHLRCVGLEPGSRCRVYGFVRREGLMDGILIGSCVTGREQIECVLETETENIGDRGKNLRDLGGMLLISDAGGFWGTEWDDQPIRPENFREWKKEKTEPQKKSEKTGIEKAGAEEQKNQKEADKIMTVEEVQEEEEGISASMMNQESKKVPQEDRIVPEENKLEMSEAGPPHPGPGPRPPEPPHPGPRPPRPPRPVPGIPYDPFNDGQFTDCRKIKPSDCSTLCQKKRLFLQQPFCHVRISEFRASSAVSELPGTVHTGSPRQLQSAGTIYGKYVRFSLFQRKP